MLKERFFFCVLLNQRREIVIDKVTSLALRDA